MKTPSADRGEQTRARILDAARLIARERGYQGTTLAMIQKRARVHPGSLYWFFKNKDELFAALVEYGYRRSQTQSTHVETASESPNPVKRVLEGIVDNPARYGLWRFNVQFMLDPDMHDSQTADVIRRLRVDTQNAMTSGWLAHLPEEVSAAEPDLARVLSEHALVAVEGCILARVAGRPVDEETITAAATASLDAMVAAACARAGVPVPEFITNRT